MTADICSAFRNVRKAGTGWSAKCPAHDDRENSLSIGSGEGGRVLLKCHANCELVDILAAAHLEHADLFDATLSDRPRTRTQVASYDYRDESGALLYQSVRFDPKTFAQRRPNGDAWIWKLDGVRRIVYRLPELNGKPVVYIAEGEKDCDRLWSLGLAATTNAGGAGKWQDTFTEQLRAAGAKQIAVIADNDPAGRLHALAVASSCHAAGLTVKLVTLPDVPEKGDVSDFLDTHSKDALIALVKAAPRFTPDAAPQMNAPRLTRLADVATESIDWLWPGRLARGKYTLLAGDPGQGKSRVTFHTAARITTGGTWPDGGRAPLGNVLFLLAEDGLGDTVRPAIEAMGGNLERVYILEGVIEGDSTRLINLARDLATLEAAIRTIKPELIVIDPITAYLGKTDSYKDAEVRGLLSPLLATIAKHRTALCCVAHLAKDQQRAALHRPGGSVAFVAAARLVFALAPDPNDADRRVLAPLKSNICKPAPSLAFRMPAGCPVWESDAVQLDAEALLRPTRPEDRDDASDATRVIRDLLDEAVIWPLDAQQALKAGAANGIHERTLRRAARQMGIDIKRVGFGGGGRWVWCRPAIPDKADTHAPLPVSVSPMTAMQNTRDIADNNNIEDKKTCTGEGTHDERI